MGGDIGEPTQVVVCQKCGGIWIQRVSDKSAVCFDCRKQFFGESRIAGKEQGNGG